MRNPIPYPLSALKVSFEINPFGFWWKPSLIINHDLTEFAKQQGVVLWWARWLWFQVSVGWWT